VAVLIIILKVIGFSILGIIGLILLIIAAVLFVPVSYRLHAESNGSVGIKLDAGWMFGALRLNYRKKGESVVSRVKIFGIPLGKRKAGKKVKPEKIAGSDASGSATKSAENIMDNTTESPKPPGSEAKPELAAETKTPIKATISDDSVETKIESAAENLDAPDNPKKKEHKPDKKAEKNPEKKSKEKKKGPGVFAKIKQAVTYPDKKLLLRQAVLLLKRLFRPIKKQNFSAEAVLGFDDPSKTGYVVGMIYAACGLFGLCGIINLSGDFERRIFLYKIDASGRLYLISFVWPIVACVFSKPVWKIVKPMIFKDKNDKNERTEKNG